jgi:thiol-disulfide isomerase/thioredoxin
LINNGLYYALNEYLLNITDSTTSYTGKDLKPGIQVSNLKGKSQEGFLLDVATFKSEFKLIFIWSPECGHCNNMIEQLNQIYGMVNNNLIEFFSYSVLELDKLTNYTPFKWNKSSTLIKGWNNSFLIKYSINYTPLLLILNKNNTVIGVFAELNEMNDALVNLDLLIK